MRLPQLCSVTVVLQMRQRIDIIWRYHTVAIFSPSITYQNIYTIGTTLIELSPRIVNTSRHMACLSNFVVQESVCSLIIFTHYAMHSVVFIQARHDHKQAQYTPARVCVIFFASLGISPWQPETCPPALFSDVCYTLCLKPLLPDRVSVGLLLTDIAVKANPPGFKHFFFKGVLLCK